MPSFLVEIYAPSASSLPELVEAAKAVAHEGLTVRYVDSIYAREDETCFHVFEGPSAADVREAALRAALPFQRIVEAVSSVEEEGAREPRGKEE